MSSWDAPRPAPAATPRPAPRPTLPTLPAIPPVPTSPVLSSTSTSTSTSPGGIPAAPGTTPAGGWPVSTTGLPGAVGPASATSTIAPSPQLMQIYNATLQKAGAGDPLLNEEVQNFRNRLSADTTARATSRASNAITDATAAAKQAARERAAAQGTGASMEPVLAAMDEKSQRAKAGAAADIALGREGQLDQLVLGGAGIMGAPGAREASLLGQAGSLAGNIASNQLGAGSLNLEQNREANTQALSAADLALRQWQAQQAAANAQTAMLMNLYNSLF